MPTCSQFLPGPLCDPLGFVRDLLVFGLGAILPGWLIAMLVAILGGSLLVAVVPGLVMAQVYFERKILARAQDRIGPNRVGPVGILQPVADAVKLLSKEDIMPAKADKLLFTVAPLLVLVSSLMIWAVIPFGPGLVLADVNVAVLYIIAMAGLPTIGFIVAGWSSNNKYALLGGMRAVAQFISYEIPGVLAVLTPVLLAGTLSLHDIVEAQTVQGLPGTPLPGWYIFYFPIGPLAFFLFIVAGLAESNRTPFDLVEAESELGAGFHTEYSGMRFALFFLAEYANMFSISLIAACLFFGGWDGPILPPFVWMLIKGQLLVWVMMWIRSTLPRLRYDQLMHFAWKTLLPLSLINVGLAGTTAALLRGMLR